MRKQHIILYENFELGEKISIHIGAKQTLSRKLPPQEDVDNFNEENGQNTWVNSRVYREWGLYIELLSKCIG